MKMTTQFRRRISLAALLLFNLGAAGLAGAAEVRTVPMRQVLAEPERFDGTRVRVIGFLRLEFQANALYMERDDFNEAVAKHSLKLDLRDAQLRSLSKLNNGRVLVEATFRRSASDNTATPPGSLHHITWVGMARKPGRKRSE
jgi:hypothetical protein